MNTAAAQRFELVKGYEHASLPARYPFGATPNLAPWAAQGFSSRAALFLVLLSLVACGKSSITASSNLPTSTAVITSSGALAIYPHQYGEALPWHVETAEASWQRVAPCIGVELGVLRSFPVYLTSGPVACGDVTRPGCTFLDANPRIEIIAASWDFDPRHPEASPGPTAEIARLYRHELIHVGLWKRDGDPDPAHARAEWACQQ